MNVINPDDIIHSDDDRNRIHGSSSGSRSSLNNGQIEVTEISDGSEGRLRSGDGSKYGNALDEISNNTGIRTNKDDCCLISKSDYASGK